MPLKQHGHKIAKIILNAALKKKPHHIENGAPPENAQADQNMLMRAFKAGEQACRSDKKVGDCPQKFLDSLSARRQFIEGFEAARIAGEEKGK